ncbi:uncharacterized protein LOC125020303 [Mugil cephalus]|uniref:uncharacterized protein LOC125020303 n=1 Tax=Mugil cephalus TaxID=48193 RepID=UPI001FB58A7A|nr:uncharacterized protein LOC125020303 [Mugil cephalus]
MRNKMMKLVLLLLLCHFSSSVKHSLKFYVTASSGDPNLPEYMSIGRIDDIQVGYCDGSKKILETRQEWMKKIVDDNPQIWKWQMQDCFEILPPLFKNRLNSLIQLFNHSEGSGVHILQLLDGCEWDETTGEFTGFSRFGYDGEDFIELDLKTLTWTALRPEAEIIKQKWNEDTVEIKDYVELFTGIYPEWLKLSLKYGNSSLLRTDVPSVSLLQKTPSSPVSCHATGFYPDRAMMFWRKDEEEIHEGVEHGEILPNHDGSFQMNADLDISSVSPEDWRRYDCVFHLSGVEDDIITKLDETQIRTNWEKPSNMTTSIIISAVIVVVVFAAAAGFMVHRKKQDQRQPPDPENSSELSEKRMKTLLLLLLLCHVSSSVKHSLKFYFTASSGVPNLPEFMIVAEVDDIQVGYCDGSKILGITYHIKIPVENPQIWEWQIEQCFETEPPSSNNALNSLIQLFNHSEGSGVHILQRIEGCEWDETTGEFTGFVQYGYDGEDFIELDLKTLTWTALRPEADIIKQKWDEDTVRMKRNEELLTQKCPEWMKMNLKYGNNSLLRTDVPSVSLLQKTPSSPVSCHATGFYPDRAMMFWRKDGEEIHEGVEHGEILPNHDGSFQMNVDLNISSVSPEDWRRYDCVFHLSGVEDDIITKLDETQIRTNWVRPDNQISIFTTTTIISAVVVVAVVIVAAAVGFMVHMTTNGKTLVALEKNQEIKSSFQMLTDFNSNT